MLQRCSIPKAIIIMMNLVTGIIVESAMKNSQHEDAIVLKQKAVQKERDLDELRSMFSWMDTDNNGTLSWDEFKSSFEDEEMVQKWRMLDFEPAECKSMFDLLDDGDGEIATDEFFEGLRHPPDITLEKSRHH